MTSSDRQPSRDQMIDFLVESLGEDGTDAGGPGGPRLTQRLLRKVVAAKPRTMPVAPQARFWAMPDDALQALYHEELARRAGAAQAAGASEADAAFDAPLTADDVDAWSRAEWWTLDEAVALLLDRDPERVRWAQVEPLIGSSEFAKWFSMLRRLAMRANLNWQMDAKVRPAHFLDWARDNDFPIAESLLACVTLRDRNHSDWRSRFENEQAERNRLRTDLETLRSQLENASGLADSERTEFSQALQVAQAGNTALREQLARVEAAAETRIKLMAREAGKARASLLAQVKDERDTVLARVAELEALLAAAEAHRLTLPEPPAPPADETAKILPPDDPNAASERFLH